jgi:hypothetical protein
MAETLPLVNLYNFDGLALILSHPSGVLYSNQVAGLGCLHPEVEGVLIPLPVKTGRPELHALQSHFRGGWWCLTEEDAKVIDGIFRRHGLAFLRVDRTRLGDSFEAWVHVSVDPPQEERGLALLHGFASRSGVVTWLNSD